MAGQSAIVMLAHGSPDPDWARAVARVVDALSVHQPDRCVALATLDDASPTGLATVVDALLEQGASRVAIVALFLSSGGRHVKRDIPQLVETLRARHPAVTFELAPGALGEAPEVCAALAAAAARVAETLLAGDAPRRDG